MRKEKTNWPARMFKFKGEKTHAAAAAELGVGIETFRAWLYGKNRPNAFTRRAVERIIGEAAEGAVPR